MSLQLHSDLRTMHRELEQRGGNAVEWVTLFVKGMVVAHNIENQQKYCN